MSDGWLQDLLDDGEKKDLEDIGQEPFRNRNPVERCNTADYTPEFRSVPRDFGIAPPETDPGALLVCWQCDIAYDNDEYEYCPRCAADLVEVQRE